MHVSRLPLLVLVISFFYMSDTSPTYYITAPKYIYPGINTSIAVHWFGDNYTQINVTGEILEEDKRLVIQRSVFENGTIGILTLPAIPVQVSSSYFELVVNGSVKNKLLFSNRVSLVKGKNKTCVLIQTEKPVYKPGETVKICVITVDRDLRPYKGQVDIIIKNPQDNIVNQWLKLRSDLGVVSKEFTLSSNAMLGYWCIRTLTDTSEAETVCFHVDEYVLPKFEVEINVPHFYIETKQSNLAGAVTAKYNYGKLVKGNVTVSIEPLYNYWNTQVFMKTYEISGSVNFSFTYEEVKSVINWGDILVRAYVTEDLTGYVMNTSSNVQHIYFEYRIKINNDQQLSVSSDLICTLKVQLLRLDNALLSKDEMEKNITIIITESIEKQWWFGENSLDKYIVEKDTLPESGIVVIKFPVKTLLQTMKIEVQYQNTTDIRYFDLSYPVTPFIDIQLPRSPIEVGREFKIQVDTSLSVQEIYYVVMAKGIIVDTGMKTNTSFTLTPEQSWAPHAILIVYFLNSNDSNSQVVKNQIQINIKGVFKNKVTLSWSKSKVQSAENVTLAINVKDSNSLVGLQIASSGKHLENGNVSIAKKVENALNMDTQHGHNTLTDALLSTSGEIELINSNVENEVYTPVRTLYPETWIWMEIDVRNSTNIKLVAPSIGHSWDASAFVISEDLGFALTEQPAKLQVLQFILIKLNLPYSVTRGEQFILEVILFNYLSEDVKVTLTLKASDLFEVIVPQGDINTNISFTANQKHVTVSSQDGVTVLFPLKPHKLGEIPITVQATSPTASDVVTETIHVKAEGVRQYYSKAEVFEVASTGNSVQSPLSKNFTFTFPEDLVEGSEEALVTVIGDFLGPSINGLECLIQMPYGCGEQNMINFAPNIYVLEYLTATQQITENIRANAISYMEKGYQTELNYKRNDGSFSAFGMGDTSGSTWLSAFVLRCFLQARPFIFISPDVLDQTIQWLVEYQDISTGIFSEPGRVIHSELQGGLNGPITLTAYILTSLLEDEAYSKLYESRVQKAVQYLESEFNGGISSNYTLSLVTYALSLANSTKAYAALTQLNSRANNIGGLKYWYSPSENKYYWQPQSTDIETAAYALLSHTIQNRISDGIPIMKWLSQQRNHLGGYFSTQDTIMALQALSQFMVVAPNSGTSLNVKVDGPHVLVPKTFHIDDENLLVLQSQQVPVSQPLTLNISVFGNGLVIVQLNIMYNQKISSRQQRNSLIPEAFSLDVTVMDNEDNFDGLSVEVCTSYKGIGNETGMALLEVGFLSGFTLGKEGIPASGSLKLVEKKDDKVYLYYDSINKNQTCVSVAMIRTANVAASQDSMVKITDYYNPRNTATRSYNSEKMKKISSCDFCGLDCSLCKSSPQTQPQINGATKIVFHLCFVVSILYFLLMIYK
ncbi:CD109 antigen [Pelobates cultripes]|uniref:CD109 antigen n=1 Tax=Pelobates cultripes TaxID=61616 RepID=A0AAD1RDM5_PELCU|nr:CD109 antigen [Pelobates cultripes]